MNQTGTVVLEYPLISYKGEYKRVMIMVNQQQIPRFTIGQRVKVVVHNNNSDSLLSDYLTYNERIGYIANTDDTFSPSNEYCKTQSRCYEVFITKIGIILEIPEKCLELAESRRYFM